jgi:hypothetical protein
MPEPGGFVEMDTDALEVAVGRITEASRTVGTGWSRAKAALPAGEAGIGSGPLGAAFRPNYVKARDSVTTNADPVPRHCTRAARAGSMALAEYLAADAAGAAAFGR